MIEFATIYVLSIIALIGMYLYLEESYSGDFHMLTECLVLVPFVNTILLFGAIFVISSIKLMKYLRNKI